MWQVQRAIKLFIWLNNSAKEMDGFTPSQTDKLAISLLNAGIRSIDDFLILRYSKAARFPCADHAHGRRTGTTSTGSRDGTGGSELESTLLQARSHRKHLFLVA